MENSTNGSTPKPAEPVAVKRVWKQPYTPPQFKVTEADLEAERKRREPAPPDNVGKMLNVTVGLIAVLLFGVLAIGFGNTNGPVVGFGIFFCGFWLLALSRSGWLMAHLGPQRKSNTPSPT